MGDRIKQDAADTAVVCDTPRARNEHSARYVHNEVAHGKKQAERQGFGEEVGEIVCAANERDRDVESLHLFADKE
eukprot:2898139-Pleurochrysis_carterae.AAC.1